MFQLNKMIFLNSLILGTLISISSYSWMTMWMGLEINLLSIIPLMNSSMNSYSTESSIKYFLTQALASLILMFSVILMLNLNEIINPLMNQLMLWMMNSALLTKLGAAPFHFWLPEVMEGLSWMNCLILLTWQKIAPLILMMNNKCSSNFITFVSLTSIMMGSISMINQISLRKILAFSSINHLGWMIMATLVSFSIWLTYFCIYSLLTITMIFLFKKTKSFYIKQLSNSLNKKKMIKMLFMLNLLSLGGLPPFLGFLPKWMIINSLSQNEMVLETIIMIILSLISLYMYIHLSYISIITQTTESKIPTFNKQNLLISSLSLLSLNLILISTFLLNSL
uniref:NADH-ubiquinone oxidoreductase chain 2 n=1 Tax=Tenebrionoidea sp. 10 KM-2017 TaxID=2219465 RepID=A0A346RIG4_9CUCU|nr:NADH dehydrogenase subunit 2 [Tenebrionoidea sp. 10 KM-2017]